MGKKTPRTEHGQNIIWYKLYQCFLRAISHGNRNKSKNKRTGCSHRGSVEMNLTSIHEDAGSVPGLTQWCCCELWCRPVATALIWPLAWEPPYVVECGPKKTKSKKINKWCGGDLNKLKSFCTAKETISKMKRQLMDCEKIFANDVTDKGLISKIYKQLIRVRNNNNDNKNQLKNGQKT